MNKSNNNRKQRENANNEQKQQKTTKRQTTLTRHRSENRQHDVLGWKDLCLGGI